MKQIRDQRVHFLYVLSGLQCMYLGISQKDSKTCLGGMHALMSFAGAVSSLMAESGLSDILSEVFGGVFQRC